MICFSPPLFTHIVALLACLSAGSAMSASAPARQIPIDTVPPLLTDDGNAYPSAHRDAAAEAAAGGAAPGWATQAQRDQLQRLHPGRVVRLRAAGQGIAPSQAPARDAWVFVEGQGAAAVRLARRIAEGGVEQVWVVLPARAGATPAPAAQAVRRSQP